MFRLRSDVVKYWPKLVYETDITLKKGQNHSLYHLDWRRVDHLKIEGYYDWRDKHWLERKEEWPDGTPEVMPANYKEMVDDMRFAIPANYMREIRHFSDLAVSERSRERCFDTSVRDMCLEAGNAAVNCAFKLLHDCLFDEKEKWWSRGDDNLILRHFLLFRFWYLQTGRGLIYDHAEFNEIEEIVKLNLDRGTGTERVARLHNHSVNIKRFMEDQEKFWAFTALKDNG